MVEQWIWKCLICGQEMDVEFEGNDKKGRLPTLNGGGTVEIDFGYGSEYDNLDLPGIWQSAVCDNCFKKVKNRVRRVLVERSWRFKPQKES